MLRFLVAGVTCSLLAVAWPPAADAAPTRITLAEALDLAEARNLDLRAAEAQAHVTGALARSALSRLGPVLHVEASVSEWNGPFSVQIIPQQPPILVREALTSTTTVTATQPLLGLFPLVQRYRGQTHDREAALADALSTRAEVRFRTTEAYLRLLESLDLQRIAASALVDAQEQARRTGALVTEGKLLRADQLRAEVAVAEAGQDVLAADAAVANARATLAVQIGLPASSVLSPVPVDLGALPPLPVTLEEALAQAARARPEIRAANARALSARATERATLGDMLPAISAIGAYQHNEGLVFQPMDAWYVGGVASWSFWEWGAKLQALEAQRGRTAIAGIAVEQRQQAVALDVIGSFVEARRALQAVDIARRSVVQAEEAYEVLRALYDNARATTTDLLDAQVSRERARVNGTRAGYEYLIALASLERAMGRAP